MNKILRLRIVEKFGSSQEFSKACGIDSSTLSKFINGYREPSDEQKDIIAKALKIKKHILFPEGVWDVHAKLVFDVSRKDDPNSITRHGDNK